MSGDFPSLRREYLRELGALLKDNPRTVKIPPRGGEFQKWPRSHFHATPELFYQTGGATEFVCPGGSFRLKSGVYCLVPPGIPHAETPVDCGTRYSALIFMQAPDGIFLQKTLSDCQSRIWGRSWFHLKTPGGRFAFRVLQEGADGAATLPVQSRQQFLRHMLRAFLLLVQGELLRGPEPKTSGTSLLATQAQHLAISQLSNPDLGVASLARQLSCHPDHLSRTFLKARGLPLHEFITRERIETAKRLLGEGTLNISEIGWACGFSTPSYFIRVFRGRTGQTPGSHRKSFAGTP